MIRHKAGAALSVALLGGLTLAHADDGIDRHDVKHVLLISVDGLHALDLTNYVASHPGSTLAALSRHGVTYTNATTSAPSDSFPGLAALVTGGSPTTTGLWYDVTWNRAVSPQATGNAIMGSTGGSCPATIGAVVELDEGVDNDLTRLDGGGGINPAFLPRNPHANCAPIMPHQYLRVNTVFEVVKSHGGRTAWTDKHPSYEWTNGPSGRGVDDFYGPEINSIPVALPQFAGCSPVPYSDSSPDDGWTTSFANIRCYDSLHVQAVLNQIDGYTHDRAERPGIPALFGANFQAVSVGEKLAVDPVTGESGGYTDVSGTPGAGLASELAFVDQSLGSMVTELKKEGHFDSTLIVVAAKHGQSPIDVTKRRGIGGGQPAATIGAAEAFDISDDGSLIWLTDPSLAPGVVQNILSTSQNQQALGIQEIFAGASLRNKFNDPAVDPRTPDIILKVDTGVIFTGGSKLAEHGGFNEDDVHTALLVAFPRLDAKTVKSPVSNQQVAATIVRALGADPSELRAVRDEQITVLPFLFRD
ncbi:MAG TPA: alkaline phosphatase family protein [Candidatus Sulfotelmatobacter sp.]|nr:alkaline phosphatase family protein [Candidatus Sulfotelmatobacter sp.]